VKLVVVNAETGTRQFPLGDRLLNVRQAAFSRDGRKLAVLVALPNAAHVSLHVWQTDATSSAAPIAIKIGEHTGAQYVLRLDR
jgi:hypothetical protein